MQLMLEQHAVGRGQGGVFGDRAGQEHEAGGGARSRTMASACGPSKPGMLTSESTSRGAGPSSADSSEASLSTRSEEHTSELQSLMRNSYAVFCLKKKKTTTRTRVEHKEITRWYQYKVQERITVRRTTV